MENDSASLHRLINEDEEANFEFLNLLNDGAKRDRLL